MATTVVECDGLPAGLTLDLELYAEGSDTLANDGGADTLTEATNRDGLYTANVTEALTGWHYALIHDGSGNKIGDGWVYLLDTTDTFRVEGWRQHHVFDLGLNVHGIAAAGTLSTTQMTTDLSEATNDHYNGCTLIFTSGSLRGERTRITDYDGSTKKLTYTELTEAPTAGDGFVIL